MENETSLLSAFNSMGVRLNLATLHCERCGSVYRVMGSVPTPKYCNTCLTSYYKTSTPTEYIMRIKQTPSSYNTIIFDEMAGYVPTEKNSKVPTTTAPAPLPRDLKFKSLHRFGR